MAEFESHRSYRDYQRAVTRHSRYVRSQEVDGFLRTIVATAKKRVRPLESGKIFWRAQLGHSWCPLIQGDEHVADIEEPHPPDRMKPLRDRASEGRANPKGIPFLYLATNEETAMAEVRPWVGSMISVAQFKTSEPLTLVDCSADHGSRRIRLEEPGLEERETAVWGDIDFAFSNPITQNDYTADYAPTQIIAELFKHEGLDGIAYRSALGNGHNVALFDIDAADLINCHLYEAREIKFVFQQAANPYFVTSHYKKCESGE